MKQSLVAAFKLSKKNANSKGGKPTGDGQIRLLIFDVVLQYDLREIRSKIPVHFDAMGSSANQDRMGARTL